MKNLLTENEIRNMMKYADMNKLADGFVSRIAEEYMPEEEELETPEEEMPPPEGLEMDPAPSEIWPLLSSSILARTSRSKTPRAPRKMSPSTLKAQIQTLTCRQKSTCPGPLTCPPTTTRKRLSMK